MLIGRAAASLKRHAWLYLAMAVVVVTAQAIVGTFWQSNVALFASDIVVGALAATVIYAVTLADYDGLDANTLWLRALERAWAVTVIDFAIAIVQNSGLQYLFLGDLGDRILAIPLLLVAIACGFADIDSVVNDDDTWWALVPRAFANSVRAAWTGPTMLRLIGIFVVQYVLQSLAFPLQTWLQANHVANAAVWASSPINIVTSIPIGILLTFVYFDASGYESKRSCGE